jgi:hypothetical protein
VTLTHSERIYILSQLTPEQKRAVDKLLFLAEHHAEDDFVNGVLLVRRKLCDPLGALQRLRVFNGRFGIRSNQRNES